jgi:hypothetical protein
MSIDLEDRLRTMYATVADTTEVRDDLVPIADHPVATQRWIGRRRVVAMIAVAAVLIVGLVVVVTHHRKATPAAPNALLKDRPFAVATWVPEGFAFKDATPDVQPNTELRGFPGVSVGVSFAEYGGASSHWIVVGTARSAAASPTRGTRSVTLTSGVVAQVTRDTEFVTVAWMQPGGYATSIYAHGITDDDAIGLANSSWWVTPAMWQQLTSKAGFPQMQLDAWHPPGDAGSSITFHMSGSVQKGFALTTGSLGYTFGGSPPSGRTGPECSSQWLGRSETDQRVLLFGNGTVTGFRVTLPGGSTRDVKAAAPPGLPAVHVGSAVIDAPRSYLNGNVKVECIGGRP